MADHQPRLRPHHREMIADRLGVGRADADIDQADPFAAGGDEVIGRHLMPPPAALHHRRDGIGRVLGHIDPAGRRKAAIRAVRLLQFVHRPTDEFVHVPDIVGEEQIALGMFGRGAGIMPQPRQAEIDARSIEQGERARGIGRLRPGAVRQFVADMGKLRGREP